MMNNFYRYKDNWHKWPPLSKLLCWIGRHDYEFKGVLGEWAILECFYCGIQKKSHKIKF